MKPLYIALIGVGAFLLIVVGIYLVVMHKMFTETLVRPTLIKRKKRKPLAKPKEPSPYEALLEERRKEFETYEKEEVSIKSFDGLKLNGILLKNKIKNKVIICCHGYHSNAINEFIYGYNYYKLGYTILCIDQRSHGTSEGKYIGMGILERKDVLDWIKFIKDKYGEDIQIVLEGVSMGAATVMMASELIKDPSVKGIIADCGFTTVKEEFMHAGKIPGIRFHYHVINMYNRILAKFNLSETNSIKSLKNSHIPLLIIHGSEDDFVPTKFASVLYEASASEIKELVIIEGAKHAESYQTNPSLYEEHVLAFLKKINF